MFGLSIAAAGGWLVLLSLVPNIALAVFFTLGLGACAGAAWVTGYTLLGLEVGDDVRGRTFAFVQSMVRVVLVSVLALGPVVAALFSKALSLPHTVHLTERRRAHLHRRDGDVPAGRAARAWRSACVSYRQMDDRHGRAAGGRPARGRPRSAGCTTRRPGSRPTPAGSSPSRAVTARASRRR